MAGEGGVYSHDLIDDSIDHGSDMVNLLASQFCDSDVMIKLLLAIASSKQAIEHVALDLLSKRDLTNAEGTQLDGLGAIVGLAREGRTDEAYRAEIGTQIQINLSGGQTEILIGVIADITNSTVVKAVDSFPARVSITFNGTTFPSNLNEVMTRLKAAGVELQLTQATNTALVFEGDPDGLGFSDDGFPNGGEFSEAF